MVRARGGRFAGRSAPRAPPIAFARKARVVAHVKNPSQYTYSRLVKMARSKRRRTCYKGPSSTSAIKTLSRDMLIEVVAIVASHSFIDLHAIKMCCKDFIDATEDSSIWRKVSLDTFPLILWLSNDKVSSFLNRCKEYGNMESLYREGLLKYFGYPNGKIDGLEILKVVAQKGHKEAKYACGMISLCSEDEDMRNQGLEHMRSLRKFKCVVGSRHKVKQLLGSIWKNNGMLKRNQNPLCNSKTTCKGWRVKTGRWALIDDDDDDDDDIGLCEYCRWDHELEVFYRLFNVH
ncbi:putative F-box protein At1g67623 [Lotus japonicus]|uniref:putative F-box protein At1g67623 n=1 Tax=Lotus japonicus TaxID=34305 RepID=UPI00258286A2|nr:putative F-box protein At1g67623 [Lotus japonicus]